MTDSPIAVRTVFERFPASVRGAVAIRCADSDPHQVALNGAAVVELSAPGRPIRDVVIQTATVDIAPRKEVLIPFEIPLAGLDPGWYAVTAEVEVDGNRTVRGPDEFDRRFVVPWPRGAIRKGTLHPDLAIRVPGTKDARVERLDLKGDRTVVRWRHPPDAQLGDLTVLAEGRQLAILESSSDPSGGRTTTVYPMPASAERVTLEVGRGSPPAGETGRGGWSAELDLSG